MNILVSENKGLLIKPPIMTILSLSIRKFELYPLRLQAQTLTIHLIIKENNLNEVKTYTSEENGGLS